MVMKVWVAIPDSSLSDMDRLEDKSRKAAMFARILAIFRVSRVIIYHDQEYKGDDAKLLRLILEFMNTPPYLRKILYKRIDELRYAGLFEPLKAPHHKPYVKLENLKVGEVRQGVIVRRRGKYYVYLGLDSLIPLEGKVKERLVNVMITSPYPNLRCKIVRKDEIDEYWGYDVIFYNRLSSILEQFKDQVLLTSRKGMMAYEHEQEIVNMKDKDKLLIVFGSTRRGIFDLLAREGYKKRVKAYNFFPEQGVESIRIEEAMLGSLAIINHIFKKYSKG